MVKLDTALIAMAETNVRSLNDEGLVQAYNAARAGWRHASTEDYRASWAVVMDIFRSEAEHRGIEFCVHCGVRATAISAGDMFVCAGHANMRIDKYI